MAMKMTKGGKVALLIVFLGLAGFGYYKYSQNPEVLAKRQKEQAEEEASKPVEVPESELVMTISGSSVINDSLSPSLVRSFMMQQGCTEIQTLTVSKKEKAILGKQNGKLIRVDVKSPGTKDGFLALQDRKADICMASAPADAEFRAATIENVIGLDGIAVISNAGNSVPELSKEDLNQIYTGTTTSWSAVNGTGSTIVLNRMGDKTGIYKLFKEMVLGGQDVTCTAFEKSKDMVDAVSSDANAIGFVSYTFLAANPNIRAIPVSDAKGMPAIVPNALTIASEKYSLCRRLYMYRPSTGASALANSFQRFVASDAGQGIVKSVGFINLTINNDDKTVVVSNDPPAYRSLITSGSKKLTTEFRFATGSDDLDSRGLDDVDRLVAYLSQPEYLSATVVLVGFTDNTGDASKNQVLSVQRAAGVKRILEQKGINVSSNVGMGVLRPARSNSSKENMAFNRRVEVWVKK